MLHRAAERPTDDARNEERSRRSTTPPGSESSNHDRDTLPDPERPSREFR
jgi:hypothetical protein